METTTTQQAATAAPGVPETPTEADFQSFFDRGAFSPTDETGKDISREDEQRLEREAQGGTEPPGAEQATEQTKEAPADKEAATEPEGKDYESLDAYLTEAKLDKDAFYSLPVAVKVDGQDSQVPLAELVKGYQLSQASYNRMNELAQQRTQFTTEQTQVRQALGLRIQQIEGLVKTAQDLLLSDYDQIMKSPQWAQMQPGERAEMSLAYQQRQTAIQQLMQQAATARQQETEAAKKAELQSFAPEREKALQARPEWRDQTKWAQSQQEIVSTARKLGASDAELQNLNRAWHLLALDAASKWFQLQASKPGVLQRVRATPKMAAPGARQTRDPQRDSYTQDREAYLRDPSNTDAAARAFSHF